MLSNLGWLLVLVILIGHFGIHLAIYNRLNGLGLPRRLVKTVVKLFFVNALLLPPILIWFFPDAIGSWASGNYPAAAPLWLQVYAMACLASWVLLGIPWLMWRPIFRLEWVDVDRHVDVVDVEREVGHALALNRSTRWEAGLPWNQVFELAIESIELPVKDLPESLHGYRIAQLSDLHLTGDIDPAFVAYAVDRANEWGPDLVALTGDIVDKQKCIDWLPKLFAAAKANDGLYFILGNHDTRVPDSDLVGSAMRRAGWIDVGGRADETTLAGTPTLIVGNEYPWFDRPDLSSLAGDRFRLLLSHSPDQLSWARHHGFGLMLAGHTHGGQGRLPLAGPILSPSLHGSRYASGDFYKPPTTMHVSRGLGGVHLLRINCRPELSLITLRCD